MQTRHSTSLVDYLVTKPSGQPIPVEFSEKISKKVLRFHTKLPGYEPTRLVRLQQLAQSWDVAEVCVKDESTRFGLKAFKVLGGSYAIARWLCQRLGKDIDKIAFEDLIGEDLRKELGQLTFATATDGNHGRGVAWMAQQLGKAARVYMPKGTVDSRVENIRAHGASVEVTALNYDDTVQMCWQLARENDWVVVQDTAWEGYTDIPLWIMQGYTTMCCEIRDQIVQSHLKPPTHVFLQAGNGAFTAAMVGGLINQYRQNAPHFIIMEPHNAACMFKSATVGDRKPHRVSGDLKTIMAGLACGEPNPTAWQILRAFSCCYTKCADVIAANGIRILAHPLEGDDAVEAGESGAVGIGLLDLISHHPDLGLLKQQLGIGPNSRLLFFNTEGATDPDNRRAILWFGKYAYHPDPDTPD